MVVLMEARSNRMEDSGAERAPECLRCEVFQGSAKVIGQWRRRRKQSRRRRRRQGSKRATKTASSFFFFFFSSC